MPMSLTVAGSLERYRREPSPEAALEVHAQLLSFRQYDQAAEFRTSALEAFPESPALRAGLASHLDEVNNIEEATGLYESALRLDPNLPRARLGVAIRRLAEDRLDEARRLLAFLDVPGAGRQYPMGLLNSLAQAYQGVGRHEETLALAEVLLRELPGIATQPAFRTLVRTSEKALLRDSSILPRRPGGVFAVFRSDAGFPPWVRTTSLTVTVIALILGGLAISNELIRRNRTLFVVNATGRPVQVQVDGGASTTVNPGLGKITLAEGKHSVKLGGAVDESHEIEVRSEYYRRWLGRPAWVLNPGGEAVIDVQTLHYAKNPRPSEHELHVGEPFVAIRAADYAFETPPDQLKVNSGSSEVTKVEVEWLQGFDAAAFQAIEGAEPEKALAFAERRLRRNPDDAQLFDPYLIKAFSMPGGPDRVLAFLKSGLDRKPPSVRWHRAYQAIRERDDRDGALVQEYDRYLAADPKNAAWLYLRGRIDPDYEKQDEFYGRAIEADPNLPWPYMARGMRAVSRADWPEAVRLLARARELGLNEPRVRPAEFTARLAAGEADALAREYHSRVVSQPDDAEALVFLCDALIAAGQGDRVAGELAMWQGRLQGPEMAQTAPLFQALADYHAGKLHEAERLAANNAQLKVSTFRAQILMALGKVQEVVGDPTLSTTLQGPWLELAVALALKLDGKDADSDNWRERACKSLEPLGRDYRRAAEILRADTPTPLAENDRVFLEPGEKALLLALLGTRFPDRRAEYFAAADRFNVRRIPPYQLIRRALDGAK